MVDVGDSSHDDERKVMKEPSQNGVKTRVVDLVNIVLGQIIKSSSPSKNVPNSNQADGTQRSRRSPVDERIAEKEVFDNLVIPSAHT